MVRLVGRVRSVSIEKNPGRLRQPPCMVESATAPLVSGSKFRYFLYIVAWAEYAGCPPTRP